MNVIANVRTITFKLTQAFGYTTYATCVLHCLSEYVIDFALCIGPSMEPTIHSNSVVVFTHMSLYQQKVERGDIVITKTLSDPKQIICKRVKAVPGDRVRSGFFTETLIPKGHVWLEGDNKDNSLDSRIFGPIPQGLVEGRVLLLIWPFRNFRNLTNCTQQNT